MTTVTHLECSLCRKTFEAGQVLNLCPCGGPLLVRYDLEKARKGWNRAWLSNATPTMWRYQPVLPVRRPESIVSLGEGFTPLIRARRLGRRLGADHLWIKDEGLNPTGTFKARGLACAVSMAVDLGIRKLAIPSAGNAASAMTSTASHQASQSPMTPPRRRRHALAPHMDCSTSRTWSAASSTASCERSAATRFTCSHPASTYCMMNSATFSGGP
ncbi:MAG: pyridoxal-phosphate dependent enzyme [Dehalococcoidia bacterium]|nr:pyridoxal-phosphate dependent enzyme [Dehalococcoidia bacterium]